jgi:hypothetical protein
MVLAIENFPLVAEIVPQLAIGEQLLFDPEWSGHEERAKSPGHRAEIGLQDSLEFEQRLVVEADAAEILD